MLQKANQGRWVKGGLLGLIWERLSCAVSIHGRGSGYVTSSAAALMTPVWRASTRASWSTNRPGWTRPLLGRSHRQCTLVTFTTVQTCLDLVTGLTACELHSAISFSDTESLLHARRRTKPFTDAVSPPPPLTQQKSILFLHVRLVGYMLSQSHVLLKHLPRSEARSVWPWAWALPLHHTASQSHRRVPGNSPQIVVLGTH